MQHIMGLKCVPWYFELLDKTFSSYFNLDLLSHKIITKFVFGTDIIQILVWIVQKTISSKWNLAVKFNCQEAIFIYPIIWRNGSYVCFLKHGSNYEP